MNGMIETKTTQHMALPEPTLRRLPWYLAYVKMLDRQHVVHVSSTQISKALSVDSSQIAKDLSFLNIRGKTRIGYEVHSLAQTLADFLGFTQHHRAVVIGVGSLGGALLRDVGLSQYGLNIVAGFDTNPSLVGSDIVGTPIYHIDRLAEWQHENKADIAILAVPVEHAQEVTDQVVDSGIKAIWNFTPVRIKTPADVTIANTSIYAHLAIIYNRMNANAEV
ncbi:MAG: redox-sensing transcriptional repressor Rex [Muribaculaceae bacterium]|nr:redox-sensing transcriptional repressor Rex [Muribaculaceae bacterium]